MPDIEVSYFYDGQPITAAGLNTAFTEVETGINDIMPYGARPGALRMEHFNASVLQTSGWTDPSGASTITVGGAGTHSYTRKYTTYGLGGAVDREICGSDQVGGGTYDSTNDRLVLEHAGVKLGMDQSDNIAGILCMYNVEYWQNQPAQGTDYDDIRLVTCLQFRVSGTWYTVNRSERVQPPRVLPAGTTWSGANADEYTNQDAATVVLLRQSDLTDKGLAVSSQVTGIRVMVALDIAAAGAHAIQLRNCRLTVLPLHASL